LPQSQAGSVYGGADRNCVSSTSDRLCKYLANNGSSCAGSYTEATMSETGNHEKDMKTDKWCSGCDSEVTQFDLTTGCTKKAEYEVEAL
jgi:hypothetical protein